MTPLVSVVLPVFNAETYVKEAVQSILDQSFQNFELIVINDGSTDGSLRILEQFNELDDRLILISRENRGLVQTLNEGINLARGQWIARMDADDVALPNRFSRQLEWLEQTGADICGSWVKAFGTKGECVLKHPQSDTAIKMELLFGCPFAHPTVMMRAEFAKHLRYDKAWEKCEDYDLWEKAARAGWEMTNVPEVLLLYRQHNAQISTCASSDQQLLTQKIRRRAWEFVCDSMKLKIEWIDEVLKLRESSPLNPNMNAVDSAFVELLQHNRGEARTTILDHATRLYFRAAADCPDVSARWGKLNQRFGEGFGLKTRLKLWVLRVFRIHSDSALFSRLKKFDVGSRFS